MALIAKLAFATTVLVALALPCAAQCGGAWSAVDFSGGILGCISRAIRYTIQ